MSVISQSARCRARTICLRQVRHYSAPGEGDVPAAKQRFVPTEGTYPKGFQVGTAYVGVKASNTHFHDLSVIASDSACSAAAVFTRNRFQAAPVQIDREILQARNGEGVRSIVINTGCANAVTGTGGREDARQMCLETDKALPAPGNQSESANADVPGSLVMSTGVIGQRLPIQKILSQIPTAISNFGTTHDHWLRTARAICTTDTFPKLLSRTFELPSYPRTKFSMAGMTKGAGMIHPNMATLLGIICTDAPIAASALQPLLSASMERSFNSISIDGDTSTNDTVALLANGAAVPRAAWHGYVTSAASADGQVFLKELSALTRGLAQLVVRDGEGATKFVTLRVRGAPSRRVAHRIASTIARSPLVKTALYGRDANWGRILCALGYTEGIPSRQEVDPTKVSVSFVPAEGSADEVQRMGELKLLVNGEPIEGGVDEAKAARMLEEEDLEILIRLGGQESEETDAVYWTCDFSHEYVTINGDYRT